MSTSTKLAYTIKEAAAATGLSPSFLDAATRRGDLKARRTKQNEDGTVTGRKLIRTEDLIAFVDSLPED